MNKEFIPYEEALALKELGFDEPCFGFYTYKGEIRRYTNFDGELNDFQSLKNSSITMGDSWVTSPTFSQAFRWFREKYGLDSYIIPARLETKKVYDYYIWFTNEKYERDLFIGMNNQYTYKEAELACLKKLIEIVKAKQ